MPVFAIFFFLFTILNDAVPLSGDWIREFMLLLPQLIMTILLGIFPNVVLDILPNVVLDTLHVSVTTLIYSTQSPFQNIDKEYLEIVRRVVLL